MVMKRMAAPQKPSKSRFATGRLTAMIQEQDHGHDDQRKTSRELLPGPFERKVSFAEDQRLHFTDKLALPDHGAE